MRQNPLPASKLWGKQNNDPISGLFLQQDNLKTDQWIFAGIVSWNECKEFLTPDIRNTSDSTDQQLKLQNHRFCENLFLTALLAIPKIWQNKILQLFLNPNLYHRNWQQQHHWKKVIQGRHPEYFENGMNSTLNPGVKQPASVL